MNPVSEVLLNAADRVEQGWCQQVSAVDATGRPSAVAGAEAVRWCAMGAIMVVSGHNMEAGQEAADLLAKRVGSIATWNDDPTRTQCEVATTLRQIALDESTTAQAGV